MTRLLRTVLLVLSGLLAAAPAAQAALRHFDFVPQESSVTFHASSTLHGFDGKARDVEGFAELDLERLAETAAGKLAVKAKTMTTDNGGRDDAMAECLEPDKYPAISFVLKKASAASPADDKGKAKLTLAGDLTIHGVTNPVEIPAELAVSGNRMTLKGKKDVSLADYKVQPKGFLFVKVRDKVTVEFDVAAKERTAH